MSLQRIIQLFFIGIGVFLISFSIFFNIMCFRPIIKEIGAEDYKPSTYALNINQTSIPPIVIPTSTPISKEIKLLFMGDIMLGRTIGQSIDKNVNPFKNINSIFENYDLRIGNLECTISNLGNKVNKPFNLRATTNAINTLKQNNIDIVSLANNHVMDFGHEAFDDMLNSLTNAQISEIGGRKNIDNAFIPVVKTIENTSIAFFGFNDIETSITEATASSSGNASISKALDHTRMLQEIKLASQKYDFVIPFMHWGQEYNQSPTLREKKLAMELIDNGASIVIGSHPHVTQPAESYKDKNIIYSLGNFIFDEMNAKENATDGTMLEVDIKDKNISNTKLIPIKIDINGFPSLK